jgi:hypothetical protein
MPSFDVVWGSVGCCWSKGTIEPPAAVHRVDGLEMAMYCRIGRGKFRKAGDDPATGNIVVSTTGSPLFLVSQGVPVPLNRVLKVKAARGEPVALS